jgi:Ran GTPase-activating protein (RanGAP) involved in mRNA processing and transport
MVLLIELPYDVLGEIIKCLNQSTILNLRIVCKETNKMVSKYGTVLVKINSLDKIKEITEKNNDDKFFRKIMFKLDLCYNSIGRVGVKTICEALKVNNSLHTLKITYYNNLSAEDVKAIGEALKVNNSLHTLYIGYNNLGADSVKAIFEALKVNNSLHTLNISYHNNIGAEGGKAIGEALKVNHSLHTLSVGYNNLGEDGGKAICEGLKVNQSLHTLNINWNNLGAEVIGILNSIANKKKGFVLYL